MNSKGLDHLKTKSIILKGSDGTVAIWNMDNFQQEKTVMEHKNEIAALDFCTDGAYFATGGKVSTL